MFASLVGCRTKIRIFINEKKSAPNHIKNYVWAILGAGGALESASENLLFKNALRYFDFCVA